MASRNPSARPRKRPRQQRSQDTVAALVEAAARILAVEGYEAMTTRRVATVAGVSIGSLYQYFPSREALVAAVLERYFKRMLAATGGALEHAGDRPPAVAFRAFVVALLQVSLDDLALNRVLAEQAPRLQELGLLHAVEQRMSEQIRAYWQRQGVTVPFDLERALFVLNKCCAELIRATAVEHPEWIANGNLADDLYRLMMGYVGLPRA